ncbi:MAG: hypothetical protein U9R01_07905 [candidate division WOR-3 bacterium]|nr:hypothetical protein [candidate division WOR-3 bacterium]
MKQLTVMVLTCMLFVSGMVYAETTVSSNIIKDTTWTKAGSPYLVTQSIDVYPDVTLTIEPGVVVKFNGDFVLGIYGCIIAIGSEDELITFTTTSDSIGRWKGIVFNEGAKQTVNDQNGNYYSGSIIKYCKINSGGGIQNKNKEISLSILNNIITNNYNGSIVNDGNSRIEGNLIENNYNTFYGGGINNTGNSIIVNNTIINNTASALSLYSDTYVGGGGIYNTGDSIISENVISGNIAKTERSYYGRYVYGAGIYNTGNSAINNNTIDNNTITGTVMYGRGAGIYNTGNSNIENNTITNNSIQEAIEAFGAGVYNSGETIINNNMIDNNFSHTSWQHDYEIYGGGLFNIGNNTSVTSNAITNNSISGGFKRCGAGIYNKSNLSLISKNNISNNNAPEYSLSGGGIFNAVNSNGTVVENNMMFENGINSLYVNGGGIYSEIKITINSNKIQRNKGNSVYNYGNSLITNNIITHNTGSGIYNNGDSIINGNLIANNCEDSEYNCSGVYNSGFSSLEDNRIIDNLSYGIMTNYLEKFAKNDIFGNAEFDFYYKGVSDQTAVENYWGTTNLNEIDSKIHDYWDDINLGKVVYEPFAMIPFNPFKGDVDGNGEIGLQDAILVLQVLCNFPNLNIKKKSDVNGDGKIGLEEVIYILQKVSGLR